MAFGKLITVIFKRDAAFMQSQEVLEAGVALLAEEVQVAVVEEE